MKTAYFKMFVTVALLTFQLLGYGQILQGTLRLGPTLDYASTSQEFDGFDEKFKTSELRLNIGGGYYIIDNLEIGLDIGVSSSKQEFDGDEITVSGIVIGPNVIYKVNLSEDFYLPLGAGFGYNSLKQDDDFSDVTYNGIGFGIRAGIEYIVDNRLGAMLLLGPTFGSLKDSDSDDEINVTTFRTSIGVNFYF